mmetsp:Transcript_23879/g.58525  ORF Transcript_23879/g.58525 Transcript_23879/m.58525 type:complete len:206 (-) Transcript_23879:156-773(-)
MSYEPLFASSSRTARIGSPRRTGSPLRTRASPYGESPVSPGRYHVNRDVLDERSILHGLDTLSRITISTRVGRTPGGRVPIAELDRTTYPRPGHHSINPLSCEPSQHDVDPYQVKMGLKATNFWDVRRPTTSGMGTMKPTKQLEFPTIYDRPRELLKLAHKDCSKQELDPYRTRNKNLWVTEKRLMAFRAERWKGTGMESTRLPW